jgi:hypothetical protein
VKEEQSGTPRQVNPEPNINDTFKLFLKPFDFLFKAQYLTLEMKAQFRQEAVDAGLLPAQTTPEITKPPTGTYS